MPPKKAVAKLSEIVSDVEEDFLSAGSEVETAAPPAKKARVRPKTTTTKSATSKTAGSKTSNAAPKTRKPKTSRQAKIHVDSEEEPETETVGEAEDVEMDDIQQQESEDELSSPRNKKDDNEEDLSAEEHHATPKKSTANGASRQIKSSAIKSSATKKLVGHKRKPSNDARTTIPETQHDDLKDESDDLEAGLEETPRPVKNRAVVNGRGASRVRPTPTRGRRAGSASDTERQGGDPALRRKLGDMTRKFENVDLKYRTLRDVGILEANASVEKWRKQCDVQAAASAELIASLKKELTVQTKAAQESHKLRVQVSQQETAYREAASQLQDVEAELAEARNQIRQLQTKLSAVRTASTTVESVSENGKIPSSAIKTGHGKTVIMGKAETAEAARVAQLKENLYADLTGLIVRGVRQVQGEEVYDCIQTGRNGTLHFKLSLPLDDQDHYSEDAEFQYTPLLDENRDRDLLEILPDYLTEDITFSREHAAKFYGRVVDTLTKRIED